MKKVIVASQNTVKINAVRTGFAKMLPHDTYSVEGVSVPSGVADQPMTLEETLRGALNRARNARDAYPGADFWVGLEGGLMPDEAQLLTCGWVVVMSGDGRVGKSATGSIELPPQVTRLIRQGMELGAADDIVFEKRNSGKDLGAVGILTGDVFTREDAFERGVIGALVPHRNPELY